MIPISIISACNALCTKSEDEGITVAIKQVELIRNDENRKLDSIHELDC